MTENELVGTTIQTHLSTNFITTPEKRNINKNSMSKLA